MLSNRSHAVKPALAVWLLVLVADTAAASGTALLVYLLTGAVAIAIVLAAVVAARSSSARYGRLTPQPIRVPAHREYRRR